VTHNISRVDVHHVVSPSAPTLHDRFSNHDSNHDAVTCKEFILFRS